MQAWLVDDEIGFFLYFTFAERLRLFPADPVAGRR
jgi:hypothetical protein